MKNEILQQLLDHIAERKAHYFYNIDGVFIKAAVQRVKTYASYTMVSFENGMLDIFDTDTISKVKRPTDRVNKCEWCFKIISKEGKLKGWILKDLEVSNT